MCPDIDDLVVALVVGDESHCVVVHHFLHLFVTFADVFLLFGRDNHVAEVERQTSAEGHVVTEVLDVVKELGRTRDTAFLNDFRYDCTQRFLGKDLVDVTYFLGNILVDEHTSYGGVFNQMFDGIAVFVDVVNNDRNRSVESHAAFVVGDLSLFGTVEFQSFAEVTLAKLGYVVETKHHVLRRHRDRSAVGRVKDVVRAEHEELCLENGLIAERQVDCHLVTVEVGVECSTCERVELDGLSFDHLGLECLDAETVKCRGTVEKDGMTFHHVFEDIPYDGFLSVNYFLCRLDGLHYAAIDELTDNEGLVKFGSHILGNTALVHFELGTDNDNRTSRIIDTLTEKVLTETSLLAFKRVGERL